MSTNNSPLEDTTLYCKARGMPFDHVDGNAILTFCGTTDGITHGAELECSYAGCRSQGPKFRYCGFCKSAVSKRNFRKRHAHGMQFSNSQGKRTPQQYFATPLDQESGQIPLERKRPGSDNSQGLQVISSSQFPLLDHLNASSCARIFAAPSPIKVLGTSSYVSNNDSSLNQNDPPQINEVPEDWAVLYRKRPRTGDSDGIKSWLLSALNIAGLKSDSTDASTGHNPIKTEDSDDTPWFCEDSEFDPVTMKNELTGYTIFPNCSPAPFPDSKLTTPLNDDERNLSFSSHRCLPRYKMYADSLSLHVETDAGGIGNLNDVLPLDSDGSMIRI